LIAPKGLDLAEIVRVARTAHGRRRRRAELVSGLERKRAHLRPVREDGLWKFGGVSWYSPGVDCGTNTGGVAPEPSSRARRGIRLAASAPIRIPRRTCWPPPICDREILELGVDHDRWLGKRTA